jgi:hypothetical protein
MATFFTHGLNVFITRHIKDQKINLSASGNIGAGVSEYRFWNGGGGADVTWNITDSFHVSFGSSGNYQRASRSQPSSNVITSGLDQFFRGGNYANWSYSGSFSMGYTFGNGGLRSSDLRWK